MKNTLALATIVFATTTWCAFISVDAHTQSSDEATIRQMDADWAKAASAKDLEKSVSYYVESSSVLTPGQPMITGLTAIREAFTKIMADPNFALSFAPNSIEVSKSGDLASEMGSYQMTMSDHQGRPQMVRARYIVVWKKIDGKWKAIIDSETTTP